jgi:L-ascorbate metabolism protein UlaG (beta-lactamase superfamily)
MQIIRGDDYQSWVYSNESDFIVVDPWLTQKQVFPGLSWLLNRDSTTKAHLLEHNLIDHVTHIIITAHFSDHLDSESMNLFQKDIPVFTTHEAYKILQKLGFTNITVVETNKSYELNSFTLKIYQAGNPYNTTTFSYSLNDCRSKVFHEPHMFNTKLKIEDVDACIVTVDMVKVLGLIQVSMDIKQAQLAQSLLKAKYFIPTGIAPKRTKGFISYLLNIKESYKQIDLMPAVCREVGDSVSL